MKPVSTSAQADLPQAVDRQLCRYWVGVASSDHVLAGIEGGFCQLCRGKRSPLNRMAVGDWLVYYSPRTKMDGSEMVQAFTAIGKVLPGDPYPCDLGDGFVPYRRNIDFIPAQPASIKPLIETLSFIRNKKSWGYVFRFGMLEISANDFQQIAGAMELADSLLSAALLSTALTQ
ncbi:EVE domain-containing protein [Phormidium tenue FACHB-886]|nr:EVE domain-containing protein [Phormidium tenue FACHB-886]